MQKTWSYKPLPIQKQTYIFSVDFTQFRMFARTVLPIRNRTSNFYNVITSTTRIHVKRKKQCSCIIQWQDGTDSFLFLVASENSVCLPRHFHIIIKIWKRDQTRQTRPGSNLVCLVWAYPYFVFVCMANSQKNMII